MLATLLQSILDFFIVKKASADVAYNLYNPLANTSSIATILNRLIGFLVAAGAPIAVILVIYGAYQIIWARGNTQKVREGGMTILYAAVGYGIIIFAWGIVALIKSVIGAS